MSYQVIARKWRPQIFEEVIGQELVTQTLRNAIEHERLHHAYIFSGARGVGKTTTARLLAKSLNCRKTDKPNATPCDTSSEDACVSCVEISQSRSMDVLEFDAASHTGVDDIREIIIENIQISAARDRYKVFIIDEVHMLSKSSFNALLKTLEEPPSNVVFVMATTELHKIPDTILSRVQEFEFRTIPLQKILNRLKFIAEAEKIHISDSALKEIARSGEGSMRDAQSNFDQVISFSGDKIDVEDVIKALGIASAENLTMTIQAIAEKDSKSILKVVDDLIARGQDLRHFCTDVLTFIRDLLVFKTAGDAENLLDTAILSFEDLKKYSEPFTEGDLIRFFNSLAETESKLREANEPRYMLEVGLIKLIEMGKVQSVESLLEKLAKFEKAFADNNIDLSSGENKAENTQTETTAEKKTLKPDFPLDEVPFPVKSLEFGVRSSESGEVLSEDFDISGEKKFDDSGIEINEDILSGEIFENNKKVEEVAEPFEEIVETPRPKPATKPLINIDAMPVRLEPIDSEELEHIDDKWLDNVYEYKLQHEGDNLKIIRGAGEIIEVLLNLSAQVEVSNNGSNSSQQSNGSATATVRAKATENKALDIVSEMTQHEEIDETIPELPENPSAEELFTFAQNHPKVKKIIQVFRGRLVKVVKNEDLPDFK